MQNDQDNIEIEINDQDEVEIKINTFPYERLKYLRKERKASQAKIAAYLNITVQQYSLYETGKRRMPIEQYIFLALYYNVTLDYLVGLIDTPRKLHNPK